MIRYVPLRACSSFAGSNVGADSVPEMKFREKFVTGDKNWKGWFPKHMHGGLNKMQQTLKNIDMVIEVHDARIPFTGRNPEFQRSLYAIRPHALVLNKVDYIEDYHRQHVEKLMKEQGVKHVFWTDCKYRGSEMSATIKELNQVMIDTLRTFPRFNRQTRTEYLIMVIGIPNSGKSSFINAYRAQFANKKSSARVGDRPGVTRHVMEKMKILEDPKTYILDTPGVLDPFVNDVQVGMKLALCRALDDHKVGTLRIVDYLLYFLNKNRNFSYADRLALSSLHDDVMTLLAEICIKFELSKTVVLPGEGRVIRPDFEAAAMKFLSLFRRNEFGDQFLDADIVYGKREVDYLDSMLVRN